MVISEKSYNIAIAVTKNCNQLFPMTDAIADTLWTAFAHRWNKNYSDVQDSLNCLEAVLKNGIHLSEKDSAKVMFSVLDAITNGYEWHEPLRETTDRRPSAIRRETLASASEDELWTELAKRCAEHERKETNGGWPITVLSDNAFSVILHYLPRNGGGGVLTKESVVETLKPELKAQVARGICTDGVIIDDPDIVLEIADYTDDYVFNCMREDLGGENEQ